MKLSAAATALIPLFIARLTTAAPIEAAAIGRWHLDLTNTKGGKINLHGTKNSGCKDITLQNLYQIKHVDYEDNFLTDTFELYTQKGCKGGISFKEDQGNFDLKPPRMIYSYKVY